LLQWFCGETPVSLRNCFRTLAGLGLEPSVSVRSDRGLCGDVTERQIAVRLAFDPGQDVVELGALGDPHGLGSIPHDELSLAAASAQGCHGQSRGIGGDGGAWSRATMCRHRSSPAEAPAEVSTRPSST
jgi:hypothetical protein